VRGRGDLLFAVTKTTTKNRLWSETVSPVGNGNLSALLTCGERANNSNPRKGFLQPANQRRASRRGKKPRQQGTKKGEHSR